MFSDLPFRLRALFRRNEVEAELEDQLRAHLDNEIEKYVTAGVPRDDAARRARLALGGLEQIKEECRDARGTRLLETTYQDIRYALRNLTQKFRVSRLLRFSSSRWESAQTPPFLDW